MSLVRDAYERGKEAAHYGFMRVSPFYDERVVIGEKKVDITILLHTFWYAGFDGEAYPEIPVALDPTREAIPIIQS